MITVEKILFLRNVPLFSGMPLRELGRVADIAEEVVYPAGSPIIREREPGDSMFLIVEGEVQVYLGEEEIRVQREHDYFGDIAILLDEPRTASVTARSDCLLLRIGQADFYDILSSHFEASLAVIRTLIRRLLEAERRAKKAPRSAEDPSDLSEEGPIR